MKTLLTAAAALSIALAALVPAARASDPKIAVVAAENFYGDVAQQLGGDRVVGHQHFEQSRSGPAFV